MFSRDNQVFRIRDTVYLYGDGGKTYAALDGGKRLELPQNLNAYETGLGGYFLRVHRSYLVAVERVTGVFERYPESETTPPPSRIRKTWLSRENIGLSGR